jgi:hypothetical protein
MAPSPEGGRLVSCSGGVSASSKVCAAAFDRWEWGATERLIGSPCESRGRPDRRHKCSYTPAGPGPQLGGARYFSLDMIYRCLYIRVCSCHWSCSHVPLGIHAWRSTTMTYARTNHLIAFSSPIGFPVPPYFVWRPQLLTCFTTLSIGEDLLQASG